VPNIYGDPSPWAVQKNTLFTFMSFVNISKYPPSLLFTCLTLGTGMITLALTETATCRFSSFLKIYGSVPFFYYILHFYLIRVLSVILFFAQGYSAAQIVTPNAPFLFLPPDGGFHLVIVYAIWLGIILALYYPCKWFSAYRKTNQQWWLSYL
jgi:hypothetical protein